MFEMNYIAYNQIIMNYLANLFFIAIDLRKCNVEVYLVL